MSPLRIPTGNPWQALLDLPMMESASQIDSADGCFYSGMGVSRGAVSRRDSGGLDQVSYNATFIQSYVEYRFSPVENRGPYLLVGPDFFVRISGGILVENDGPIVLLEDGASLLDEGDRGAGATRLIAGIRYELPDFREGGRSLAFAASIGYPLADDEDLLASGGTEVSGRVLWTVPAGAARVHLNAGLLLSSDATVFAEPANVSPVFHAGLALAYPLDEDWALVGQVQGNTNPFRRIDLLEDPLVSGSAHAGTRFRWDERFVEMSGGRGLGDGSADWIVSLAVGWGF